MAFWKKKTDSDIIVQCSICEWNPDGESHWSCSCGHQWNTFATKGKCPNCTFQWESTRCPGCGITTPHREWYKTKEQWEEIFRSQDAHLRERKLRLEARLIDYGIRNYRISHLSDLDLTAWEFHTPFDAGCRMMVLYAMAYSASNLDDRELIIDWLKREDIREKVSPYEKEFLSDPHPDERMLIDLSYRLEGALTLGWCLKMVDSLPRLDDKHSGHAIDEFVQNVPQPGDSLQVFLSQLEFRDMVEVYEETLINEFATTYFRDLLFTGKSDATDIDRYISLERHTTLNWLRKFGAKENASPAELWDETDTST
jgi:hypothetical protein